MTKTLKNKCFRKQIIIRYFILAIVKKVNDDRAFILKKQKVIVKYH